MLDPRHGVLAFPLAVFLVGILPAVRIKKARIWLLLVIFGLELLDLFKIGAQEQQMFLCWEILLFGFLCMDVSIYSWNVKDVCALSYGVDGCGLRFFVAINMDHLNETWKRRGGLSYFSPLSCNRFTDLILKIGRMGCETINVARTTANFCNENT